MSNRDFLDLLIELQTALEERYCDEVNRDTSPSEEFYYIAQYMEEMGLGAVYVAKPNGHMGWLSLEDLSFQS